MNVPPPCSCGRGPACWTVLSETMCLQCAPNAYKVLVEANQLAVADWLNVAGNVERCLRNDVNPTSLIALMDQLQALLQGFKGLR